MTSGLTGCRLPDEAFSQPDSRARPLWWLGGIRSILRATRHEPRRARASRRTATSAWSWRIPVIASTTMATKSLRRATIASAARPGKDGRRPPSSARLRQLAHDRHDPG